ncbi:MAG: cupin domain-containing protein [Thermoleophilia bacterium]
MIVRRARATALAAVVGLPVLIAGCGDSTSQGPSTAPTAQAAAMPLVSTINGKRVPGVPSKSISSRAMVDAANELGMHIYVFRSVRAPGTRAPIHVHPYGGWTCVAAGQMTLYMDGSVPQTAKNGQCYYMPPNMAMTGVNTGTTAAVLVDNFEVPKGQPYWRVVEKGQMHLQTHIASGN